MHGRLAVLRGYDCAHEERTLLLIEQSTGIVDISIEKRKLSLLGAAKFFATKFERMESAVETSDVVCRRIMKLLFYETQLSVAYL